MRLLNLFISLIFIGLVFACAPVDTSDSTPFDPVAATMLALDAEATAESMTIEPTATLTLAPSATFVPTRVEAIPTLSPTPAPTAIPFEGFLEHFRFYRAWWYEGKTFFYFLNAGIDFTMYAKADDYLLNCESDPKNPSGMICEHEGKIEEDDMDFAFYLDETRQDPVFEHRYNAELKDNTIYHYQYDCPDRGKNVSCVSEYRLYDGRCYYSHTCYDACGLYYSKDNLPKEFKEFQGFTTPCN